MEPGGKRDAPDLDLVDALGGPQAILECSEEELYVLLDGFGCTEEARAAAARRIAQASREPNAQNNDGSNAQATGDELPNQARSIFANMQQMHGGEVRAASPLFGPPNVDLMTCEGELRRSPAGADSSDDDSVAWAFDPSLF